MKKGVFFSALALFIFLTVTGGYGAEKLTFATAIRETPQYYMPLFAAEEKGLWKTEGLNVKWAPFKVSVDMHRAVVAGQVKIGSNATFPHIVAVTSGVPMTIIGEVTDKLRFMWWVRADSRHRTPGDLRGGTIGTARLGVAGHLYSIAVAKILGLEKEIRLVAIGGVPESVAALRAGVVDATVQTPAQFIELQVRGEVRKILDTGDYLPADWVDQIIFATPEFVRNDPATVRKVVKVIMKGINYSKENASWTIEKMKAESGYSEQAARIIFQSLVQSFTRDGKVKIKSLENVTNFLVDYSVIPKGKMPKLDDLYVHEFAG